MASADGMGYAGCKVNLCSWACITAYNHINHQARRELTVVMEAEALAEEDEF